MKGLWIALSLFVFAAVLLLMPGCISHHVPTPTPDTSGSWGPWIGGHALDHISSGADWLALLSIVGIGVGAVLFFVMPEDHRYSLGVAGGAGAMLATCMVVEVTLPFVPWVIGAIVVGALAWFGYELYTKMKGKSLSDLPAAINSTIGSITPVAKA